MADFSKDFQIAYDDARDACAIRFRCFDTPNSVTAYGVAGREASVERALLDVKDLCLELHFLWSFSMPESDVSRMNDAVGRCTVDGRTASLIQAMADFNRVEPAFDFTIGAVSRLWKHAERVPSDAELRDALALVGAGKVRVEGREVVKADPGVRVDVGGAAKGFAADLVAAKLRAAGIASADVDLGGNLFMLGRHPEGRPWRVSVRVPEGISAEPVLLEVEDESVVTSGSYERFAEIDGVRYQHIVDPRTGRPSKSDLVSATAVCASSLHADMLATALLLAGSEGFPAFAARHPEARFCALTASGETLR